MQELLYSLSRCGPAASVSEVRAQELSVGQSSMAGPDSSLINSLITVCLEVVPLLFLLLLLVTFLKSPCSSLNVVSLEGKMQYLSNTTLQPLRVEVSTVN